jgi:hypothetical protein
MRAALLALAAAILSFGPPSASGAPVPAHHPLFMPDAQHQASPELRPPPVCCSPVGPPAAGEPANMAYFGGPVQVTPKVYLVFWGWGQPGAFDHTTPGMPANDPDGAAALMTHFIGAVGGTAWAGVSTQYYETVNGVNVHVQNPAGILGGVWYDDANPIHDNLTGLELAKEAQRAVAHFNVADLANSQFVIAQPQRFNEAGFSSGAGYCAWHDFTQTQYYPGVQPGISFTNMPYVLNEGASCGESSANAGSAGRLDGFTIVLGHEVEETITDPGAEDVVDGQKLGGWYDYAGYENGGRCAWAGDTGGLASPSVVPGGVSDITGNDGQRYAVQSLWSNGSAACAGAGHDVPAG